MYLILEMVFSLQRKEDRVMSHAYDPELWKLRQEKEKFKASVSYILSLKPDLVTWRHLILRS